MPKTRKEEYLIGYKVFFRSSIFAEGKGKQLRSMFAAGSCKCWHPECNDGERLGVCQYVYDGSGIWRSYDYGSGHFTAALCDEAPLTLFESKATALAFMRRWRGRCFELWEVSYVLTAAPMLYEKATLPPGTTWASAIRPDKLIVTLTELLAEDEEAEE